MRLLKRLIQLYWRPVMSKLDDLNAKVDRVISATQNVAGDVRSLQATVAELKAELEAGGDISQGLSDLDAKLGAAADNLESVAGLQEDPAPAPPVDSGDPSENEDPE